MADERISEVSGHDGRPVVADMTIAQVQELAPDFCGRLEALGLPDAVLCGPYLARTVGDLAAAEHIPVEVLLAAAGNPAYAALPGYSRANERLPRERPEQRLAAPAAKLELAEEVERLREEPAWQQSDRNSKTLVKHPDLRVVLLVLKAGAHLEEHHAPGAITVQALAGRVRFHVADSEPVDLLAGEMFALDQAIVHDLEAVEASAVLLTIAWHRSE